MKLLGQCELTVVTRQQLQCPKFYVLPGNHGALLGYLAAKDLNLIHVVNAITDRTIEHPGLFNGIGKLNDKTVKIYIDETIKPVAQRHRQTQFHLRPKVE